MSNEPAPIRSEMFSKTGGIVREWAMWFQHAYENFKALLADVATLKAVTHYFGPTTQSDITSSRALGTVYQNTTGKAMFVNVVTTPSGATNVTAYTDASNPPTTVVFTQIGAGTGYVQTAHFVVLPNNYYKVAWSAGSPTLQKWIEWY